MDSKVWKILTVLFAATTIAAIVFAINASNDKPSCPADQNNQSNNSSNNSSSNNSSNNSSNSGSSSSSSNSSKDSSVVATNLKDFDVSISGLVNASGFGNASILTLRTDPEGEYMIGEVKSGDKYGYAYRALPNGSWTKSSFNGEADALCQNISDAEMQAFVGVKMSTGKELTCSYKANASDTTSSIIPLSEAEQKLKSTNH